MGRVQPYSRDYRYSGYVRNSSNFPSSSKKARSWNSSWKTSSWRTGVNYLCPVYRTRHFNEVLPMTVSTGSEFIHSGYISMPALGLSNICRKKKFILLKGIEMQGTLRLMSLPVDSKEGVSMKIDRLSPPRPGLNGMATLFVILDKKPRGDVLSKFEDIFEFKDGAFRGDACLRNSSRERFAILMKKCNIFQGKEATRIIPFSMSYVPKEKIWVKFQNYDDNNRGGNFNNIAACIFLSTSVMFIAFVALMLIVVLDINKNQCNF